MGARPHFVYSAADFHSIGAVDMEGILGAGSVMAILILVLSVLWIALPFAIFGIKPRLDRLIALQAEANDLMRGVQLQAEIKMPPRPPASAHVAEDVPKHFSPATPPEPATERPAKVPTAREESLARARELAAQRAGAPTAPGEHRLSAD